MRLIERFKAFWYTPTIDAMQAQMLRYVWRYRSRERRALIERLSMPLLGSRYRVYRDESMPYPITLGAVRNFAPSLYTPGDYMRGMQ